MKERSRIRLFLEATAFRFGMLFIPLLPRFGIRFLGRALPVLGWPFLGQLRRIAHANLMVAFGDSMSPAERKRIVAAMFCNFCVTLLDIFWFSRFCARRLDRWVVFDDSTGPLFTGKGWLGVTGHFGNWETVGQAVSNRGFELHSIAATLNNPVVDQGFIRLREKTGQIIVPQEGAVRQLLGILRKGGRTAVLLDQNTLPRDGGLYMQMFGLPVPISPAPAAIALRVGVTIVFGFCILQPDGRYRVFVPEVIEVEASKDPAALPELVQRLTSVMEREIRARPEYWLWCYKRFKLIPPGHDGEGFPYYARPAKEREL